MTKWLAAIIVLLWAGVAEARYCSSPWCAMCNRIFGRMTAARVAAPVPAPTIASTPRPVVDVMLAQLELLPDDILYDLGCGDGRILIAAVKQYGCKAVGIERDSRTAAYARQRVAEARCGGITIVTGDIRDYDLGQATAVTMYLFPALMKEVMPKVKTRRVVSFSHTIPGRACRQVMVGGWTSIYILE